MTARINIELRIGEGGADDRGVSATAAGGEATDSASASLPTL
jgi:hypothetical protein